MKLSIVVVFYNEFDLIVDCIKDLQKNSPKNTEIILVDNNSEKAKAKRVMTALRNVKYIRNKSNLGFAKAVNIGLRSAKGDFLLFSTPDLRIMDGTIEKSVEYMMKNKKVGVVGCRVLSPGGKFHPSAFRRYLNFNTHIFEYNYIYYKYKTWNNRAYHPDLYTKKEHENELRPAHMIGAFLLMRKKAAIDVNYFDERYFLYREETDLCLDMHNSGWEIAYIPINGVTHVGSPNRRSITQSNQHYQKSTYLLYKKHKGLLYVFVLWFFTVISLVMSLVFLMGIFLYKKIIRQKSQAGELLKSYIDIMIWHFRNGLKVVLF